MRDTQTQTFISEFIESLRIDRGCSEKTIEAYLSDLTQFQEWIGNRDWKSIQDTDLHRYFSSVSKQGQKPASVARKTSSLRQFFKFCCLEKGFRKNPAEALEIPSQPKRLPKYLTSEQIQSLLDFVKNEGLPYSVSEKEKEALRARDAAMIYILYATGLRVTELVTLSLQQIETSQGYLRVKGKGDKQRIAPFAPIAGEKLVHYLEKHRSFLLAKNIQKNQQPNQAAFLTHRGEPITRKAFWELLKRIASDVGLPSKLSPHMLRHSFATHLLQSGMGLRSLQTLLGHSDLSSTQIYTHIAPEHLKKSHRKYHPRGE
jgi:integrase/recombinase XerD